jgi:hypothetical protein
MNNNIDLNIDNYSIGELKSFFKLSKNYTNTELNKKVSEMELTVSLSGETDYKYKTLYFINQAKQILTKKEKLEEPEPELEEKKTKDNGQSNLLQDIGTELIRMIGSVIDARSRDQSMQFSRNAVPMGAYGNGYGNNTVQVKNYILNTVFREDFFTTTATNSTFTLPKKMKNVISMDLSAIQFPNYLFSFSNSKKTTSIYIKEDVTGNEATVFVPEGNYTVDNFPPILEERINQQVVGSYIPGGPNRFTVTISPISYFTTIKNSTYTFTIITNKDYNIHDEKSVCVQEFNSELYSLKQKRYFRTELDGKKQVRPEQYFLSMGWLIGYRSQIYAGKKSYTSEGNFQNVLISYVYFTLNDFSNNYTSSTTGIFDGSYTSDNILAVIPVTAAVWTSNFDNNSNFIYKTRTYNGPTDIERINIQLQNPFGGPLALHGADFAFCLQVTHLIDPIKFEFSDIR